MKFMFISSLAILSFLVTALIWQIQEVKGQAGPQVSISQFTQNLESGSPRFPFFITLDPQQAIGSLAMVWEVGIIDKSVPGRAYAEPRRQHWINRRWARIASQSSTSENRWQTFQGERSDSPGSQILNRVGFPLLFQESMEGSCFRGGGNLFVFDLKSLLEQAAEKKWDLGLLSVLPYSGKDPEFVDRYRRVLEAKERLVKERGRKLHVAPLNLGPTQPSLTDVEFKQRQADIESGKFKIILHGNSGPGDMIFFPNDISTKLDYGRVSAVWDSRNSIWLTGLDRRLANNLWVTHSKDTAKSWEARKLIGRGNYPTIASVRNGDLLVFSTRTKRQFGWQGEWPADTPKAMQESHAWPGYGTLVVQRSTNNGMTWSEASKVLESDLVIQNRVYTGPDGRLWLAYVLSDIEGRRRTSLWLMSSSDNGVSWEKPRQITDGKTLDREPDLIWHEDKLLLAFSRAGRGFNTNIWLAEVKP